MGRRPNLNPKPPKETKEAAASIGAQSPDVQDKIDSVTLNILEAVEERLKKDLKKALDSESVMKVITIFQKTVRAVKRPPSTIQMIKLPDAPQAPAPLKKAERVRDPSLYDREQRDHLRGSAQRRLGKETQP